MARDLGSNSGIWNSKYPRFVSQIPDLESQIPDLDVQIPDLAIQIPEFGSDIPGLRSKSVLHFSGRDATSNLSWHCLDTFKTNTLFIFLNVLP